MILLNENVLKMILVKLQELLNLEFCNPFNSKFSNSMLIHLII